MGCVGLHRKRRRLQGNGPRVEPPAPGDHRRARRCQHTPSSHTHPSEKNKKMPIRYVDASLPVFPAVVRTRSRCAESAVTPEAREPSDAGVRAPEALPKTSSALPKIPLNIGNGVTENTSPVTEITPPVTEKRRGRPPKPDALTAAEKQRRYRARLKAAKVSSA